MVTSENEKASSEEASFYVTDRLFIEKRLYKICTHISLVKLNTASACQPEAMLQRFNMDFFDGALSTAADKIEYFNCT